MSAPGGPAPAATLTVAEEEGLWTALQLARFLGASRSLVYRETAAGRLPHVRILGLVRYVPAQIRAFVAAGRSEPARLAPRDRRIL